MSKTFNQMRVARNRSESGWDLARLGLLMAGLGAGARGFQGLTRLGQRNMGSRPATLGLGRPTVDIPLGRDEEEEKFAAVKVGEGSWSDWLDPSTYTQPIADAFKGDVSTPSAQPWAMPAALIGGPLAAYGGYKLTDKLMDKRRSSEQEARLAQAKKDYEEALSGRSKLGEDLNQLCLLMEKTALGASDWAGYGSGAALTLGGLLALGTGMATYDMSKKKQPSEVLRAARQRRDRERMRRTPPPIFARVGDVPDEDELEGEPLDKAANAPTPPPLPHPTTPPLTTAPSPTPLAPLPSK